ncbi:MAG TPA: glycogen debranching N-terminal domain-containing protein [Gemmatimonadales bacterium]|nr:glycogen debranching N-terminal domain-containing protein [Gemmatimonadales bacterium]
MPSAETSQAALLDEERRLVLKHDRLFLVATMRGDIHGKPRGGLGLFQDDTRLLNVYELRVAGGPPSVLSYEAPRAYCAQVDLAVNDVPFGGDAWDPKYAVHIRRELILADRLYERLTLTNYLARPVDYWIELALGSDFADIFEVRGWQRGRRGTLLFPEPRGDSLHLAYQGLDGKVIQTAIWFRRPPSLLTGHTARWEMTLARDTPWEVEWEVRGDPVTERPTAEPRFGATKAALEDGYRAWRLAGSNWKTDAPRFDVVLRRAIDDLAALYGEVDGAPVITAGIPWYSTVFGRDSIIASLQTLPFNSRIARETLRYLARRQGAKTDRFTEEEPGKILHETRRGELARTGEIPHVPYFGSVDATPLWLILLHETWRWTGDTRLVTELLPNAERALAWIDGVGDPDQDGFVEYEGSAVLRNQGWKDSGDAVAFPDGRRAEGPIALVEVQGYVYDAKVRMAALYRALGRETRAAQLEAEAATLRQAVVDQFWSEELRSFVLALDGSKCPIPTVTSNAGHLLWSRVPTKEQAAALGRRLLEADLFSGWGVRTLSTSHPVYNPMSYHNGSVWPHDNAILVLGLALNDQVEQALPIVRGLHDVAVRSDFQRLPELFCGLRRQRGVRPIQYPVSCSPQAWASGAVFMMLQAVLGLYPDAPAGILHVRNPSLPDFLNELTVSGLRVGDSFVTLEFRRYRERTLVNLLDVTGDPLQMRIELP